MCSDHSNDRLWQQDDMNSLLEAAFICFKLRWLCSPLSLTVVQCNNYLSLYLLQMTTFGNMAPLIGSVEETRLVVTVEVLNCFTVLEM